MTIYVIHDKAASSGHVLKMASSPKLVSAPITTAPHPPSRPSGRGMESRLADLSTRLLAKDESQFLSEILPRYNITTNKDMLCCQKNYPFACLVINLQICVHNLQIWDYLHRCCIDMYVVGSKSFRPDIKKPRQMENAVRDI